MLISQMPQSDATHPGDDREFTDVMFEVAGVANPECVPAANAALDDSEMVIGITVGDEHRAYQLSAMSAPGIVIEQILDGSMREILGRHVVNDVLNGTALTVTHCDVMSCSKVYRRDGADALEVGVGGWKGESMVLTLGETRFSQRGESAPLPSIPFELVRWGEWKSRHPDSTVYVGD